MNTSRELKLVFLGSNGYYFFTVPYVKSNPDTSDIRALVNYLIANFGHNFGYGFENFISATLVTTSKNAPITTQTVLTVPED